MGRAPHQQRVLDGALEIAERAFDGAVLVGDAGTVARRLHAVMTAELIVAARQVCVQAWGARLQKIAERL